MGSVGVDGGTFNSSVIILPACPAACAFGKSAADLTAGLNAPIVGADVAVAGSVTLCGSPSEGSLFVCSSFVDGV